MWLIFSPSIQSAEERRSQIFVMAVKIKIIHIRISKIHKMSCIWNIQNTYQNSPKAYVLRRLKRCEILLHWKPERRHTNSMNGYEMRWECETQQWNKQRNIKQNKNYKTDWGWICDNRQENSAMEVQIPHLDWLKKKKKKIMHFVSPLRSGIPFDNKWSHKMTSCEALHN